VFFLILRKDSRLRPSAVLLQQDAHLFRNRRKESIVKKADNVLINWTDFPRRAIHLDFHTMPGIYDVGRDFDAAEFAETLSRTGVDYITVFAKCNLGFAYYPTKLGIIHPGLKKDLLGPMVNECHCRKIRVTAYFNAGLDHENALRHREWCKVTKKGEVYDIAKLGTRETNFFRNMCFNTGYRDYLLGMIDEVICSYPVDGIFLDCMVKDFLCYGVECLDVMKKKGWDPHRDEQVLHCSDWVTDAFMADVRRLVAKRIPKSRDFKIHFNGAHYSKQPTHIELEILPTGGWGYDFLSLYIRYARTFGKPYFTMTGRFHGSWGDFGGIRPKASLEFDCYNSIANGGTCSVGDHMHPRGPLDGQVYNMIGDVYSRVRELEPWTFGAQSVAEIAVLDPRFKRFDWSDDRSALQGVARMLVELKYQFNVCDGNGDLSQYRLLVLPDSVPMDEALKRKLSGFLGRGGTILSSGESGLNSAKTGFALKEYCLNYGGADPYNTMFFQAKDEISRDLPKMLTTIYKPGIVMTLRKGAKELARMVQPYFNRASWDWRHDNFYTPPEKDAGRPAIAQCGDKIIHLAFPVFTAYFEQAVTAYKCLVRNCLERLLKNPLIKVENMPSFGQVTLMTKGKQNLVHLLTYMPELRGKTIQIIEEPITVREVNLALRMDGRRIRKVYLAPSRANLDFIEKDGYIRVTVPEVQGYQLVVFE